jgi:hypothetical protein
MAVHWASTPDWNSNPVTRVRFPSFAPKRKVLAKHIYHLPLLKIKEFIKENKSILNEVLNNSLIFEYRKNFGKTYFDLQIEAFIEFFKINKDMAYSLKTIKYFTSEVFLSNIYLLLDFNQFTLNSMKSRDFFYTFVFVLIKKDKCLCEKFFHKVFLHFYTTINKDSNINIDYLDLCKTLAKNRKITLKESFGEDKENKSFFKIYCNEKLSIEEYGNSIKTLRKKAYKKLCFILLDEV